VPDEGAAKKATRQEKARGDDRKSASPGDKGDKTGDAGDDDPDDPDAPDNAGKAGKEARADAQVVADARKKFRRANSEYQRFRKKHGGQLQSEWTALLKFATFAKNDSKKAPKLVKKIDGFRAKMRKIERDTL
jgi:hypothetical protein